MKNSSRKSTRASWAAAPSSSQKVPLPKNYFAWHVERRASESRQTTPPQIKWRCPAEVGLKVEWRVASGKESHETETQRNREYVVAEALYAHHSLIPPNPSDLLDKGGPQNDDSRTPVIPLTPCDDAATGVEAEQGDAEANASTDAAANVGGWEDANRQLWVGSAENPLLTISMVVLRLLASNPELRSAVLNSINGECASLPGLSLESLGVLRSLIADGFVPCRCATATANVAVQTEERRIRDESNSAEDNLVVRPQVAGGRMSSGDAGPIMKPQEELARHSPLTTNLPILNGQLAAAPPATQCDRRLTSPCEERMDRLAWKYLGASAPELRGSGGGSSSMEQGRSRLHQYELKELVERYGVSNRAPAYPSSSSSHQQQHNIRPPTINYGAVTMNRPIFRPNNVPSSFGPHPPTHPPGTTFPPVQMVYPRPPPYNAPVPSLSPLPSNHQFYSAAWNSGLAPPGTTTNSQQHPCMYFSTAGVCPNGENCPYLHVAVPHQSSAGGNGDGQAAKRMRLG